MTYNVNFTNPNIDPLQVRDNIVNEQTSLKFPGRNYTGYGQIIAENFLHLLENFANDTPPENPVAGQLWYDTTEGVTQLKINVDGTPSGWQQAGGLKKGVVEPTFGASLPGDLFVNTSTQQLYLFSGATWVLVGPKFSSGSKTGAEPEIIYDTLEEPQTVVVQYVDGERIAIISKTTFTPKSLIDGFSIINAGITLNSNFNKYYGVAEKAAALLVGTSTVSAENFLRSDVTSNTNFPINVRSSEGLSIGENRQFGLFLSGSSATISNKTSGSNINVQVADISGVTKTVLTIDSQERVGINKRLPSEALDVNGNAVVSGSLSITNNQESTTTTVGAFTVVGGVGIGKNLRIGVGVEGETVGESLRVDGLIRPDVNAGSDIGTSLIRFNNIYSVNLNSTTANIGEIRGGTLVGTDISSAGGSAPSAFRLTSDTQFTMSGDITSAGFSFNGTGGDKNFATTLSSTFITSKPSASSIGENDEFIISRPPLNNLLKIRKSALWAAISRMPIGMIAPFAGPTAPVGWLLCDGSEVLRANYPELFEVIRYTYGDPLTLQGQVGATFKLPDLRGRFPLGFDNMTSGLTVPSKANPLVNIETGGGDANRVRDEDAEFDSLDPYAPRNGSGNDSVTINISNLPDHKHDLRGTRDDGTKGQQYYAIRDSVEANTDVDKVLHTENGPTNFGSGQFLPNSGGVLTPSGVTLQTPVDVMNPFLAMNFIIYTGKDL
jgi:microcystin-dependent protein